MPYANRTYRISDEERIEGRWRSIFLKNGDTSYLNHLTVYADGLIQFGFDLVDFATFQQKVASGWIATTFQQGTRASAHHLAGWRFDEPQAYITAQQLIGEVADEIEHLAGRPASDDRCREALYRYLDEPTDELLAALHDAYLMVPEHLRRYLLHDQDSKDWPLRVLITPVGELLAGMQERSSEWVVTAEQHQHAWEYFQQRRKENEQRQTTPPWWEDDAIISKPSIVRFDAHDGGHPYLANDYPAPLTIDGVTFPTVEHAYWALATTDPDARVGIANAPTAREARDLARNAALRPDWPVARLAVMTRLVREKFRQHPDLAAKLIATGDARLINSVGSSRYWGTGRNWLGRVLELVRAELVESAETTH